MELLIRTDWPQFANDVADVVRIFFGAVPWKTEPLSAPAREGGEDTLVRCRDFLYRVLEKETEQ